MDDDPFTVKVQPADLVGLRRREAAAVESLPEIWDAAEALISPHPERRSWGLKRLSESEAARHEPLLAYLLFTRLNESAIELRAQVVALLAPLVSDAERRTAESAPVFATLTHYLSQLNRAPVLALLQVADFDRSAEENIVSLLEHCSYAGEHLAEILADRRTPLSLRIQALRFITRLGYLDALPTIERLVARLSQRRNGWHDGDLGDESSLLPLLQEAVAELTAL